MTLKMYFLLKMGIFQPAMLVYQRVDGLVIVEKPIFVDAIPYWTR